MMVADFHLLVRLQARVATFLAELPLDRLVALAEGRARLTVWEGPEVGAQGSATAPQIAPVPPEPPPRLASVPASPRRPARGSAKRDAGPFDAHAVVAELRACETLDEATERLAALKLSAVDLKLMAKALNIAASGTKDQNAKKILALTVGSRSKHAGLRQG